MNRRAEELQWKKLNQREKREFFRVKQRGFIDNGRIYNEDGEDVSDYFELATKVPEEVSRGLSVKGELAEHEKENGGFFFAFFIQAQSMSDRFPELTQSDLARLMFIGTYVAWQTNRLQYDNGRIIDKKALNKLLGMNQRNFRDFWKRLESSGIVQEYDSMIYVNPSVFYRGNVKKLHSDVEEMKYARMFKKTIRDLYEQFNGRTIKQLALIYCVIPWMNFDTNIVCNNPNDTDAERLSPMSIGTLADHLGYERPDKLKQALERIKLDGEPVFYCPPSVHDRRQNRVIINPNVVYAGNGEMLAAIKILFN